MTTSVSLYRVTFSDHSGEYRYETLFFDGQQPEAPSPSEFEALCESIEERIGSGDSKEILKTLEAEGYYPLSKIYCELPTHEFDPYHKVVIEPEAA